MSDHFDPIPPVLEAAWKHFADFDNTAKKQQAQYLSLRRWVLYLSVIATLLTVVLEKFRALFSEQIVSALQIILILMPIISAGMLAYLNMFKQGQKHLIMRAGAEEILKEVFLYRTLMQHNPVRDKWLNHRLTAIQRRVHQTLGGEMIIKPYSGGSLNPDYAATPYNTDKGIADLDSEAYLHLRLEAQLARYINKIQGYEKARVRMTAFMLLLGGLGALFAGLDMLFAGSVILVTLTTAFSLAITNWQELKGVNTTIPNCSKVILELNIIRDHWLSLPPQEQTLTEFYQLVRNTEKVLWNQNTHYMPVQASLYELEAEYENQLDEMIEISSEVIGLVQENILEEAYQSMKAAAQTVSMAIYSQLDDNQRLPDGMIFNAVLGPVPSAMENNGENEKAISALFGDQKSQTPEKSKAKASPKNIPPISGDEDDPLLAAINTAVAAAIEESETGKIKSKKQQRSPASLVEDEATKAAQEAANEYIKDAAEAFSDLDDE